MHKRLTCVAVGISISLACLAQAIASPSIIWSGAQNVVMGGGSFGSGQGSFSLDLNADGINDFEFEQALPPDLVMRILGESEVVAGLWTGHRVSTPLTVGTVIGDMLAGDNQWVDTDQTLVAFATGSPGFMEGSGPWANVSGGYMGVSFDAHDGTHYGWVRITASGNEPNSIIHDWAFETIPGQSIGAGVVPEPSTVALFTLGLGVWGLQYRTRKRRRR